MSEPRKEQQAATLFVLLCLTGPQLIDGQLQRLEAGSLESVSIGPALEGSELGIVLRGSDC